MKINGKRTVLVLAMMVLLAGIALKASFPQDYERFCSLDGAWLVKGDGGATQGFLWMDTFTSDPNKPGVSGTVLCTLPNPLGLTQSGQGNWLRIGRNRYAFTAWRFTIGPSGLPNGTAKFWGTLSMRMKNETSGTMNIQYYDLNGQAISPAIQGTSAGQRIEVVIEDQP